jgi:secreted Zn-dependent insulinase-like peptidase
MRSMMQSSDNSRIENFYQIAPASIRKKCLGELLESVLDPKAFDFLRNKHQLGYSVGVALRSKGEVYGFSVYVVSQESKHTYQQVHEKIETFMDEIARKVIEELTSEEFESFKQAQIKLLLAEDLEIREEVYRNWNEITSSHFLFNRNEMKINVMKALTKFDLQDFFNSFTKPENLRKLNVQVIGNIADQQTSVENHEMKFEILTEKIHENENLISNVDDFKDSLELCPPFEIDLENL